jgi:hypothetical protein
VFAHTPHLLALRAAETEVAGDVAVFANCQCLREIDLYKCALVRGLAVAACRWL